MRSLVIVGAQWGDEGKGKLVDVLTERADIVVRFQGGNNAGHTLVIGSETVKLSLIPSGVLRPQCRCFIGAGVVVNLEVLLAELSQLAERGVDVSPGRILIDSNAEVILPYHVVVDRERERRRGTDRIGTTGRGIGPAYEDRAARVGVRMAELSRLDRLKARLAGLVEEKNRYLKFVLESEEQVDFGETLRMLEQFASRVVPYIGNVGLETDRGIRRGENVVFEGAQGTLLDVVHGTVPYVTSSCTLASSAAFGTGVGPKLIGHTLGVTKAYTTRVGEGPFPTELHDEIGERIRSVGREFGTVTGRPRRTGWLDLVALKRAVRLNGIDSLAITKIDVLSGLDSVNLCVGYELDGKPIDDFPPLLEDFNRVRPVYRELAGWSQALTEARRFDTLPQTAQEYLRTVEELMEVPVSVVGVGAERSQNVFLQPSRAYSTFIGESE